MSCLETKSDAMVDHLLQECDLIGKFLQTDKNPLISGDNNKVYGVFYDIGILLYDNFLAMVMIRTYFACYLLNQRGKSTRLYSMLPPPREFGGMGN